jgi:thiol:disulfide interchange protein
MFTLKKSKEIRTFGLILMIFLLVACSSTDSVSESQVDGEKVATESASAQDSSVVSGDYISYQDYQSKLENYQDSRVVLFFNASWCSTCKIARDNFEASLDEIPADMAVVVVDFDNSTDLRKKYGVTIQHTFVQINSQEDAIKKWSGSTTISEIIQETV